MRMAACEAAFAQRDWEILWLEHLPELASLHREARFPDLLRRRDRLGQLEAPGMLTNRPSGRFPQTQRSVEVEHVQGLGLEQLLEELIEPIEIGNCPDPVFEVVWNRRKAVSGDE